jgi:hypothetical protein
MTTQAVADPVDGLAAFIDWGVFFNCAVCVKLFWLLRNQPGSRFFPRSIVAS